jgi:hypothetical protein
MLPRSRVEWTLLEEYESGRNEADDMTNRTWREPDAVQYRAVNDESSSPDGTKHSAVRACAIPDVTDTLRAP